MRLPNHLLLLATAAATLAACASSTEVRPDQDAIDAAVQLRGVSDDAYRAGADPDVTLAYRDVAYAVTRNGRVSPVTIVVDGVPLDFLATAQQLDMKGGPACTPPQMLCDLPPLRTVVAWERANPRRMVQLTAPDGSGGIGQLVPGAVPISFLTTATLTYLDGMGGIFVGTSGTQQISTASLSDRPCTDDAPPSAISAPEYFRCTRAELTASFSGSVTPPPFIVRGNTASGTHTIAMAEQPLHGARLELMAGFVGCATCDAVLPFLVAPPVNLRGGDLRAILTAVVAPSRVTLELRITNPQTVPVTVQFTSGQQYDFRVRRLDGSTAWVWSADKAFTQALGSRTLGAGETVAYSADWAPTEKGSFLAEGRLTSSSHYAVAAVGVIVP